MWLFDSMSPAFNFWHDLKKLMNSAWVKAKKTLYEADIRSLMDTLEYSGLIDENKALSSVGVILNNSIQGEIHMWLVSTEAGNYLAEDWRTVIYSDIEFSVFIIEAYVFYLELIWNSDRSAWKIDNIDLPILQGIINQ